jgi:transposase
LGYPERILDEIIVFLSRNSGAIILRELIFVGLGMFIGKKKNKSGKVSVRIFQKVNRTNQLLNTIGCSSDPDEIKRLIGEGHQWIEEHCGATTFDFDGKKAQVSQVIDMIDQLTASGVELLLGKIFDEIGFNQIPDDLFRKLVLARLCYPVSKLKTTTYLARYHHLYLDVHEVYRYLDKLHNTQKELVQDISYRHTLKILGGRISVVFYDVTTLYFETEEEDELRKPGFSKDGKPENPQIVLGLLVGVDGYPLAYEIFEGNKYEGHTMLPVINGFKMRYKISKLVVIADAGLLSGKNIQELIKAKYEFIIGGRIRHEQADIKQRILDLKLSNGECTVITKADGLKVVVSYTDKRAVKDKINREKGIKRLEKQVKTGKLTKASINNRGYNKFLKLSGTASVNIDYSKISEEAKWDGLKGYVTNTKLTAEQVIGNYQHLWKIERAFRISKNELKIRPIFHRLQRRIEAHICITFTAYKVYKELERQLKVNGSIFSPEEAIDIAQTIFSIQITIPETKEHINKVLTLTTEQLTLASIFKF